MILKTRTLDSASNATVIRSCVTVTTLLEIAWDQPKTLLVKEVCLRAQTAVLLSITYHTRTALLDRSKPALGIFYPRMTHSRKFGVLEKCVVRSAFGKAIVKYVRHFDAQSAYQSPDVLFGNRFVKVYWGSTEHLEDLNVADPSPAPEPPMTEHQIALKKKSEAVKAGQDKIQGMINEQKRMMTLIDNGIEGIDRDTIVEKINSIGVTMREMLDKATPIAVVKPVVDSSTVVINTLPLDPVLVARLEVLRKEVR